MKRILLIALTIVLGNAHFSMASQDKNEKHSEDVIDFTMTGSGYFIHSPIQSQEDGLTNHMNIRGKSKQIGDAIVNVLAEVRVKLNNGIPENCTTPQNDQGIRLELVKARGVVQLAKSGDQIFTKGTEVDLCMSLQCFNGDGSIKEGCTFQPSAMVEINGGTGPFACATGHIADTHTRIVLAMNSKGEPFGSISSYSAQGTVQIPKNCDD